ncbi:unnamed protein product [marine sediment metagenome]|uniref:PFL domain-containing protein n=1 Tax=marine sediment metagenome TaxID=412755 RepID=X1QTS8_9ZZZZ
MNERVKKLRRESLDTQPYISIQRASLITKAYKKHGGTVSTPVLRALAFKHVLENKSIYIGEGEYSPEKSLRKIKILPFF